MLRIFPMLVLISPLGNELAEQSRATLKVADNLQRTIIQSVRRSRRTALPHSASGREQSRPTLHQADACRPYGCLISSPLVASLKFARGFPVSGLPSLFRLFK